MKIFIVSVDTIADVDGYCLFQGGAVKCFYKLEDANAFVENVKETYFARKSDYSIDEFGVE